MIYVISDIHGEYEAYKRLLKKINFSDSDELFVLGDCVDRGPEPIKLLQDMMSRGNVFPILGNHDYMALMVLKQLMKEITDESCEAVLNGSLMQELLMWQQDGGNVTLEQFQRLDVEERYDILDYLEEFSLYEEITVKDKCFVMVHAGLDNFNLSRPLDDYGLHELIFSRTDYEKVYFENKYLVTGHTPTSDDKVLMKNNHIAIDCGRVFGGRLAVVCLNTLEVFYE